jgi:site-specific DNA-methyltransferase (adenine-specific)
MAEIPDKSVALVVTSPPYFAGKAYEEELGRDGVPASYLEYLDLLRDVLAECVRTLEPGGRIAVNVANLGRKPYRSLSADVIRILQDDLRLLLRGEVVWVKAKGAVGSVAWGSYRQATNPVLRDVTERVIIASKGRFDRARSRKQREAEGLPFETGTAPDEFLAATLDVWEIPSESAKRVNHPAPFPVELPQRLIKLYTYEGDLVLDPFMGSGTTLVAALREGRLPAGYDLDPEYVETARARVSEERRRVAVRSAGEGMSGVVPAIPPVQPELPDPDENFQARASREGRVAQDIARMVLEEAGFESVKKDVRLRGLGARFNFSAVDRQGGVWFIDVTGAFTTTRGGLLRTDSVWKALGRALVLREYLADEPGAARLLLLTSHLPRAGSEGDKALRAASPGSFWDAIAMLADKDRSRLAAYAAGDRDLPVPGFWTEEEIDRWL